MSKKLENVFNEKFEYEIENKVALLRITTTCTQTCSWCMYSCSPQCTDVMSLAVAQDVRRFLDTFHFQKIQLMGGECFLHPQWNNICSLLIGDRDVRIVTNGDWARTREETTVFLEPLQSYTDQITIAITEDCYHTNMYVQQALAICKTRGFEIDYRPGLTEMIYPVGRARLITNFWSTLCCHCRKPGRMIHPLIIEDGTIYVCGLQVWDLETVSEALEEEGDENWWDYYVNFLKTLHSEFISGCAACVRYYYNSKHTIGE